MPVPAKVLRRFVFFRPLDAAALEQFARYVNEQKYRAGDVIFQDGDLGDIYYLVQSGRVHIVKRTQTEETLLNEISAGEGFGEMSLIDDQPRSATARAAEDATLLKIPKNQFIELVQRFPVLLYQAALTSDARLRRRDREWVQELENRNWQLEKLYETSLSISRQLELRTALAEIADRATQLLDGREGALHLYDPSRNLLVALQSGETVRPGTGVVGRAFGCREGLIENPTRRRSQVVSALAAPICLGDQSLGVLTIYRTGAKPPFTPQDMQLLLLLANQAAIAIESSRLHRVEVDKARIDGELHVARQVQERLIPRRAPRIPGFKLAALWRPAREVSGDFYDFIPLAYRRWGLVIADVSDKGMPAALFMATARSILRASAIAEMDASAAVAHANRVLCADATQGMFVTLFFAILDPRTRQLTYVNAGHNPPILLRAQEPRVEYLGRTALPLGLFADTPIRAQQVSLRENDVLVLYTDGVTEATNATGELYGEARLIELIRQKAGTRTSALERAVDASILEFTGNRPLADDVTLVALNVCGKG